LKYQIDIYKNNPDNSARFALGMNGKRPLFVIGLNPSTADDKKPDMTITKIRNFAQKADFDGFVMLNLYAQRTLFPDQLHPELNTSLHQENVQHILQCLEAYKHCSILTAWGATLAVRPYVSQCLTEIKTAIDHLNVTWLKIGDLTQDGHPRHPSRAAYALGLTPFDMVSYLRVHGASDP
jgi:hypothetical protein